MNKNGQFSLKGFLVGVGVLMFLGFLFEGCGETPEPPRPQPVRYDPAPGYSYYPDPWSPSGDAAEQWRLRQIRENAEHQRQLEMIRWKGERDAEVYGNKWATP
jgi:hypothetical protein